MLSLSTLTQRELSTAIVNYCIVCDSGGVYQLANELHEQCLGIDSVDDGVNAIHHLINTKQLILVDTVDAVCYYSTCN